MIELLRERLKEFLQKGVSKVVKKGERQRERMELYEMFLLLDSDFWRNKSFS